MGQFIFSFIFGECMKNNFIKFYNLRINLRVLIKLLVYTTLLGVSSEIIGYFNLKSPIPPAEAQVTFPTNPITKYLVGRWETKIPQYGEIVTFIFTADHKFYMIEAFTSPNPRASEFLYRINSNTQPMQLELTAPSDDNKIIRDYDKMVRQINFEFTDKDKLSLDFLKIYYLHKVSNFTNLPQKTIITNVYKVMQYEPKNYIMSLVGAQQAYRIENIKFAGTINQLQTGIPSDTENYHYQVLPQGNGTQRVMMTAIPKRHGLKSYTGAVFILKNGQSTGGICETNQTSFSAPVMPKIDNSGRFQCSAGSRTPIR
jgi:hypothetical protein